MRTWIWKALAIGWIFSTLQLPLMGQDTIVVKSAIAGSYLRVPEGREWMIDRAFINGGDGYNIQIRKENFKKTYFAGDTLRIPYYLGEMEILTNHNLVYYQLYIREKRIQ